jgi:large subunit ribosomal protein L29
MKTTEIKGMSTEEILAKCAELRTRNAKLKFKHHLRPLEDTSVLKKNRRDVARMLTELSARSND